ncbi:MAG TPA: hypothetical protein PLZ42_05895 [Methanothrix sp.]|nr:hypothetical protein [Methanothrix sp.]
MKFSFSTILLLALTMALTVAPVCLALGEETEPLELQKGELLFMDDFETTKVGGSWGCAIGENQSNYYEDGKYIINVVPADSWWRISSGKSFGESIVEVEATPIGGPDDNVYGIMTGWQDWSNYYLFMISGDGYFRFSKRENTTWTQNDPWTKSDSIKQGKETNLVQVKRQGETLSFYANGFKLADYVDDSFPEGKVGIMAGTTACGGKNVTISFDNFSVWEIKGS